jgi:diguanylate cyclase (GGDEF)-like protein/PAS domain S-box-containing protein
MPIRSRIRPSWLITGVFVMAIGLVALGMAAVKAERTESRQSQLQQRAGGIETELNALWALSDKTGRAVPADQANAAASMRKDLRSGLASAAASSPENFKALQKSFAHYDQHGHEAVTPILAKPDLTVESSDTDALKAMLLTSRHLKGNLDASHAAARSHERTALIALTVALILAFSLLGAFLVPARKAAIEARKRARDLTLQREMEERFQPVFERHPQAMAVSDAETLEFLAVNDSMVSRYGYSREELLTMKITDLHLRGDAVKRHIAEQGADDRASWIHLTKSGEEIEVEVHARSMMFGGRPAAMALGIDVTERNRIARALAESEERHRTVVETAQEGIVVYDLNGVVQLMNASMGEILGVDPEEQSGRRIAKVGSSGDHESIAVSATPPIESLLPVPAEVRIERTDGQERFVLGSSSPWADADGAVKGTVVMCSDITEQRLSEARIRESDALKTAMLDSSLDGIYTLDPNGDILEFNRAAEQMFQISRSEAIGRNALELLVPVQYRSTTEKKLGPLMKRQRKGRIIAERLTGWRADGTEFPAEVTVATTDGGEAHVTVHVRDITERFQHEHTLKARARQQAAVADLGAFSLQAQSIDAVYEEAANAIQGALGAEFLQVSTFGEDLDADIDVPVVRGFKAAALIDRRTDAHRVMAERIAEGPVIVDVRTLDSPHKSQLVSHGIKSALIVGVIVDGVLRGSISVQSTDQDVFGSDERYFMTAVANVVGAALARNEAEERMRDLALHDSLTRLPNRAVFEERLIEWAQTAKKSAAVAFVDVDHFKVLNDALGHQAGDQLLCALAPRFAEALGESALVARFGGDEFVVLVEDVEDDALAKVLGERLLDTLTVPVEIDGRPHHVSVSVGIKLVQPGADDLESAVRDADSAMYQAKERGRDRVEVFDEALHQRVVDRLRVDRDLRIALEHEDQLWCAYQPLISSKTREVVGIEALARWRHPELGQLSPAEFIPAAEELGLIGSLGWYILERAVHDAASWVAKGGAVADAAFVSVNLSPQQLADPSLAPRISVLLDDVGLSPQRLTLEVTETTLMADTELAQRGLEELAALGVRLVLDDFGTGFSSMAYLSRMPVSGIKVDRSFISGLGESARSDAIVRAIVSMAEALELEVVAEGVETEHQATAAIAMGCDKLQGFLFSKPVPAAEIDKLAGSSSYSVAA